MANPSTTFSARTDARPAGPRIRKIGTEDIRIALSKGLEDFWANPTHLIFIGLLYPIVGLLLCRMIFGYGVWPLLYPLAAGFALIGPLAALGIYELSRRREKGLPVSWNNILDVRHSPSIGAIVTLGLVLMAIFIAWLAAAHAIFGLAYGDAPPESLAALGSTILTTPAGWTLLILGNGVGFLFAVIVLAISVVSFPLLLDRDIGAAAAVVTSLRATLANPVTMALWGLVVAAALALGSIPFFFGLAFVMPVLGHATWHLYRRLVER